MSRNRLIQPGGVGKFYILIAFILFRRNFAAVLSMVTLHYAVAVISIAGNRVSGQHYLLTDFSLGATIFLKQ